MLGKVNFRVGKKNIVQWLNVIVSEPYMFMGNSSTNELYVIMLMVFFIGWLNE